MQTALSLLSLEILKIFLRNTRPQVLDHGRGSNATLSKDFKMDYHHELPIHRFGPGSLVDQVSITGLERTKLHTVLREFEGLEGLNSIDEVYLYLQETHEALMSLDLFEAVDILIDESAEVCPCYSGLTEPRYWSHYCHVYENSGR